MKNKVVAPVCALALAIMALAAPSVRADTLVGTINGFYDQDVYDSPSLHLTNTSGFDFTNVQMTLTGYQGLNNGLVSPTINLGTIAAGTTQIDVWNSLPGVSNATSPGNLTAYDYDDSWGNTFGNTPGFGLSGSHTIVAAPQCGAVGDWNLCAQTGNFYVTITAQWDGQSIFSQFSPGEDPFGIGNACGNTAACYVGWEGLDPNGWSETTYDSHSNGGPNGVLANIYVGTPPSVPEPSSLMLLGTGLVGLLGVARRKLFS